MAERDDPNILLMLTDQERYDLSGPRDQRDNPYTVAEVEGEELELHEYVDTPTMDKLQEEGIRFDNAYTPIGICTSARASLMTGRYPHKHGMLNNCHEKDSIEDNLNSDLPTFSEILEEQGYNNTYLGKWHVGQDQGPEDFGFEYIGGGDAHHDSEDTDFLKYLEEGDFDIDHPDEIELEDDIRTENGILVAAKQKIPKEATHTYYMAERTIEQLEEFAENDKTFFHRTDFPGPHHPYIVPEEYADKYDPEDIKEWANFDDNYDEKPPVQESYLWKRGVEDFDWDTWSEAAAKYFGFVSFIDEQMGRVVDRMDELGLKDNTAVIHTADHGDFTGSHGQFNKGPMRYEEIDNIPLIARWPDKIESGTTSDEYVRLLDLMPTFVEMAGEEPPKDIDGRSILPILEGEEPDDWPESVFLEYHGDEFNLISQRAVVKDDQKTVLNPGMIEHYDLEKDPYETENVAQDVKYQNIVRDNLHEMADWMEETEDPWRQWNSKALRRKAESFLKPEVDANTQVDMETAEQDDD